MIEEGKLLKISHSALQDNPLTTTGGNSETNSKNLLAPRCSSELQFERHIKRQKTYELEASQQKKNVQAAAAFWAVMRQTRGFQNKPSGPQIQDTAVKVVAPHGLQNQDTLANEISTTTIPGTSSKQQAAPSRKNHNNPKRRRGPDNEYTKPNTPNTTLGDIATLKDTSTSWPDITSPAKRTKQYTGEYTEPNTTKTPVGDSLVGSSENAESNTANEENKQRQSSPVTPPRLPHGFQNQVASPQVQAAAANEVEPSPESGTSSRQQAKAFTESQGNPKRKRGSDDEYTDPTNHTLDTIIARPAKYIAQTTHGFETRTEIRTTLTQ